MYKVIQNGIIIDVIERPKFIKFLASGHVAITDKSSAQGIVSSDGETLYCFAAVNGRSLPVVSIVEIDYTEFNRLTGLLNYGKVISADESALANAKRDKLAVLSGNCKNKITAGFTVTLSDGEQRSFRLTTEDQLNLIQIENQLANGESTFIYHATAKPCEIYLKDDMIKIIKAFKQHVLYHTTYYNVAKQYINALTDIEKVNLFSYGMDVSECVTEPVLKQILKNGGNAQ